MQQVLIKKEKIGIKTTRLTEIMHKEFSDWVVGRFKEIGISSKYAIAIRKFKPLQDNYFYISNEPCEPLEVNITGVVDVEINTTTPEIYEEFIEHLNEVTVNLYAIKSVTEKANGNYTAIRITLNKSHTMGYYLTEKNTFVFGNIVWHDHYLSIVLKNVWPQILEKLNLT